MRKIITERRLLRKPTEKVESIEEGEKIAAELFNTLKENPGIGLTANQIGINKSVFVVNVTEPKYFINPEILETSEGYIPYVESCLSIPKKVVTTARRQWIKLKADNYPDPIEFGSKPDEVEYTSMESMIEDEDLLECIAVQHEFDHTLGLLITDRNINGSPRKVAEKIGRNQKVQITDGNNTMTIKYKKFDRYKEEGWELVL